MFRHQISNGRVFFGIGFGERLVHPVYSGDVVFALSAALFRRFSHYKRGDLPGPEAMTCSGILDQVTEVVERNPAKVYVPLSLAYAVAWRCELIQDSPCLKHYWVRQMRVDRYADISSFTEDLGYTPRTFAGGWER